MESIFLAKKRDLPLDHYVFDRSGNYTEYAGKLYQGKSRKAFYMNIIDALYEIGNMGEVEDLEVEVPYMMSAPERLLPFLLDEWYLDIQTSKEDLQQLLEERQIFLPYAALLLPFLSQLHIVVNRQLEW